MNTDADKISFIPGKEGKDCPGNGSFPDGEGGLIACCCDECDFLQCCVTADSLDPETLAMIKEIQDRKYPPAIP